MCVAGAERDCTEFGSRGKIVVAKMFGSRGKSVFPIGLLSAPATRARLLIGVGDIMWLECV